MYQIIKNKKAREAAEEAFLLVEEFLKESKVDEQRFWEVLHSKIPHQPVVQSTKPLPSFEDTPCPIDSDVFPFKVRGIEGLTYGEVDDAYYAYLSKMTWIEEWPQVLRYIEENKLD